MDKLIIASMHENAGKTGVIVGLAKALDRKIGYMKPLGDRLLYRKKLLWDQDASVITSIFGLVENPMDMSLGFDHSKLRFMYNEKSTREKLNQAISHVGTDKEVLFVESGKDVYYGISVYLDALSLAEHIGGKLILVVSGDEDAVLDDLTFVKKRMDMSQIEFGGVIINKLHDVENFENTYLDSVTKMGINVLGMIPYTRDLTRFSVGYLADRLFARVVAGANGLNGVVQNVLVGAMTADAAIKKPDIKFEDSLVITGGDRSDMIVYALESKAVGIILTNNILPPSNIISQASERQIPLLLVNTDTYETAKQIDDLQPLLSKSDSTKVDLWEKLVREHVNVEKLIGA